MASMSPTTSEGAAHDADRGLQISATGTPGVARPCLNPLSAIHSPAFPRPLGVPCVLLWPRTPASPPKPSLARGIRAIRLPIQTRVIARLQLGPRRSTADGTSRITRRPAGGVDDTTDAIRAVACIRFVRSLLWLWSSSSGQQSVC